MKDLIDRIHSDTEVLMSCIHNAFIKYYGYSLNLTMLITLPIAKSDLWKEHLKRKLVKHDRVFRNFCKLIAPVRKFTKLKIKYDDNGGVYEINMNYENDNESFLNNEQWLDHVEYFVRPETLGKHIITTENIVNEDFKKFCENVDVLYHKSQNPDSDFSQQEERLKELEEKFKDFELGILKDTACVYEKSISRKHENFGELIDVCQMRHKTIQFLCSQLYNV